MMISGYSDSSAVYQVITLKLQLTKLNPKWGVKV